MKRFLIPVALAVAMLVPVACGGGGGSVKDFTPTAEEKGQATAVVQDTKALESLKSDLGGDSALGKFTEIYSGASYLTSQQMSRNSSGSSDVVAFLAAEQSFLEDGCQVVSGNSVTYNNCGYSGSTIDGFIKVNGDDITIDLTITFSSGGYSGDYRYSGAITVTDTLVDGALSIDYDISSLSYDMDVRYDAIQLVDGCAVGGGLRIELDASVSGYGGINAGDAVVEVAFGPSCGEMTMKGGN